MLAKVGDVLREPDGDLLISRYRLKQAEGIALVRSNREAGKQPLAFASRPFILCGLPSRRPPTDQLLFERRNGNFLLQITGHPHFGLPFGQDRLVLLFLATLAVRQKSQVVQFRSAAEMLDMFGMAKGGKEYRHIGAAFEHIFGATIFFSGPYGLTQQLGCVEYSRPSRFRVMLEQWLKTIRGLWPECPATNSCDGQTLQIQQRTAIAFAGPSFTSSSKHESLSSPPLKSIHSQESLSKAGKALHLGG